MYSQNWKIMNAIKIPFRSKFMAFTLPILLLLIIAIISKVKYFSNVSDTFYIGLTLDFIVTTPLLYFLLIRKQKIPNYTVLSVAVLCLIAASLVIPHEHQSLLRAVRSFAIPILEVLVFAIVFLKVRKTVQSFKVKSQNGLDFYDALLLATSELFPKTAARLISSEIAMLYYLLNWKRARTESPYEFSYHRKSGIILILCTLLGVASMELFAVHILLESWSTTAAWIATGITIYSFLQIIALMRSIVQRPNVIDSEEGKLKLKYGYFAFADIEISQIEKILFTARTLPESENMMKFSPLGILDSHNTVIYLKEATEINNLYTKGKQTKVIGVFFDDKAQLRNELVKINKEIRFL